MFWALARVSFRAAKIVSCNKKKNFMVYDQNYHNCSTLVNYYIQPYNSSSKFLILILVDFSHFTASAPPCVQPLIPPKQKIIIEIPPYYIDTLVKHPVTNLELVSTYLILNSSDSSLLILRVSDNEFSNSLDFSLSFS
jgi:hypothetical protein